MILFLKKQHNVSINTLLAILLLSTSWQESSSFIAPLQQHGLTSTPSTSSLEFSKQVSIDDRLDQLETKLRRITAVSDYLEELKLEAPVLANVAVVSGSTGTVTTQGSPNSGSYLDGLKSQSAISPQGSGLTSYLDVLSREYTGPVSAAGSKGPSSYLDGLKTTSSPSETRSTPVPAPAVKVPAAAAVTPKPVVDTPPVPVVPAETNALVERWKQEAKTPRKTEFLTPRPSPTTTTSTTKPPPKPVIKKDKTSTPEEAEDKGLAEVSRDTFLGASAVAVGAAITKTYWNEITTSLKPFWKDYSASTPTPAPTKPLKPFWSTSTTSTSTTAIRKPLTANKTTYTPTAKTTTTDLNALIAKAEEKKKNANNPNFKAEQDAKASAEAEAKAKAEADAKAKAEAESRSKAEVEARSRAETQAARARAEAEARAKAEAEAEAAEEARAKAEAEKIVQSTNSLRGQEKPSTSQASSVPATAQTTRFVPPPAKTFTPIMKVPSSTNYTPITYKPPAPITISDSTYNAAIGAAIGGAVLFLASNQSNTGSSSGTRRIEGGGTRRLLNDVSLNGGGVTAVTGGGTEKISGSRQVNAPINIPAGTSRVNIEGTQRVGTSSLQATQAEPVPKINNWRQLSDGTIRGFISGSKKFKDGFEITTSPVYTKATPGVLVETVTGSRYYLDKPRTAANTKTVPNPQGIPVLSNWMLNADGSLTGEISGARGFRDGEEVTTSPLLTDAVGGAVVTSETGSRYFLQTL